VRLLDLAEIREQPRKQHMALPDEPTKPFEQLGIGQSSEPHHRVSTTRIFVPRIRIQPLDREQNPARAVSRAFAPPRSIQRPRAGFPRAPAVATPPSRQNPSTKFAHPNHS
jgi:hypothetical protein